MSGEKQQIKLFGVINIATDIKYFLSSRRESKSIQQAFFF